MCDSILIWERASSRSVGPTSSVTTTCRFKIGIKTYLLEAQTATGRKSRAFEGRRVARLSSQHDILTVLLAVPAMRWCKHAGGNLLPISKRAMSRMQS